jgi:hypothetical protein
MLRRLSSLRRSCVVAIVVGLVLGVPTVSAGTRYVDGISDQSLPAWDGAFSSSDFASFFDTTWVGQVALARYVVQWNVMAQASDGPNADGDYRERFEAWLDDVHSLGLAPVLALTSYTGVYPSAPDEYRPLFEELLEQAAGVGEPIGYVEAWNEPNVQGDEPTGKAGEIANWATSVCVRLRCQVIAGDLEDNPSVSTYERAYISALDFHPAIWGIHPYYAVKAHDDATVLRFEQALPNRGAGAQLWFTEIGAYYCAHGEIRGEAQQASDASYLVNYLIPAIAPTHVFYYGFMAANSVEASCSASGGDDTELYRADGQPRAAANVILTATADDHPALFGSNLNVELLVLAQSGLDSSSASP